MIPIHLDPQYARIALIGRSALTVRRLAWLRAGRAEPDVWSDDPIAELTESAAGSLQLGLPGADVIASYHAIWIADLEPDVAAGLAGLARAAGVLVNVEDVLAYCDFHTPAVERRGLLTLSAGTGGASPAAARVAREQLARAFPPVWGQALAEISAAREALRATGAGPSVVAADARTRLAAFGLLAE
jgi:precorrin-2 dehydrogenase / sirohydrochlorin ferrochelatase